MSTYAEHHLTGLAASLPAPAKSTTVDAIVLGGHHWRRSALESVVPRPLLPVAQRPLLSYALQWLGEAMVASATVCTNGLSKTICAELGRAASLPGLRHQEDRAPRGPAGCVRDALHHTGADQILVLDGSVIPVLDLDRLLDVHARAGAAVTIVVQPAGRQGPSAAAVPTGIYVFDRSALELVPASGFQDIKETLIPRLYAAGALIVTHQADGPCPRVLDAATYLRVNHWLIGRIARRLDHRPPFEMVDRHPSGAEVIAHPTARIDPGACLIGPVLVGPLATIASDAVIIGPASIGADTSVRENTLISRSVIWERCAVDPGATVDGAVVMHDGRIEAGERVVETVRSPAVSTQLWSNRGSGPVRRTVARQHGVLSEVITVQLRS